MESGRSLVRLVAAGVLVVPLVGCGFYDQLGAMRVFKEANTEYARGDYEGALKSYQQVLDVIENEEQPSTELAQQLTPVFFYVGNSHDNLYRPGRDDPENMRHLEEAIRYYELGAERIPTNTAAMRNLNTLSMQYLVAAFGPDKANDPSRAEPVLRQMVLSDPENPENYFRLAQLYEEAGLFDDAEAVLTEIKNLRPDDPVVYLQLAGFYNRAGEFEQTMDALEARAKIEPDNPEAYYTISTYFWEKAFRDFTITQDQKREYVMAGLEAADRALALNDRYVDALTYKNILLRLQANMTTDADEQKALIAEADELRDRAEQLADEQRQGAAGAPPAA